MGWMCSLAVAKWSVLVQSLYLSRLYVHVRVQIQSMSQVVKLLVIDLTGGKLQAILGQSWLSEHSAVISFRDKVVRYLNGDRRAQLKCVPPGAKCKLPALPSMSPPLLTRVCS